METFNYLSVLLSIILGLAIAQVLQGLRGMILARVKVKPYLPTFIWIGIALLIAVQAWWASFGLHVRANWTFWTFIVIVLQAVSVYMVAALVLPDLTGEVIIDLREHYFAHRKWFFGALLASILCSAVTEVALRGHLPDRMNGKFRGVCALAAIIAAISRRAWVHQLLAPAMALTLLLYITLLFSRL